MHQGRPKGLPRLQQRAVVLSVLHIIPELPLEHSLRHPVFQHMPELWQAWHEMNTHVG